MSSFNRLVGPSYKPKNNLQAPMVLLSPSSPIESEHMELRVRGHSGGEAVKWLLTPPEINCSLCCWGQRHL